jgi:hypothetical protein
MFNKKKRIYCQKSGKEIIPGKDNFGAYVSNDGRAFDIHEELDSFYDDCNFSMDYRTYSELQSDIKIGKLIHFGKLEVVLGE